MEEGAGEGGELGRKGFVLGFPADEPVSPGDPVEEEVAPAGQVEDAREEGPVVLGAEDQEAGERRAHVLGRVEPGDPRGAPRVPAEPVPGEQVEGEESGGEGQEGEAGGVAAGGLR